MFGDNASIFKENILEIIDNWNGYSTQPACVPNPATQAGIVELRCFINNSCPFNKSNRKEDVIIFNTDTMLKIFPQLPKASQVLTCTDGVEGIHFRPRYVFRHNYVYKPNQTLINDEKPTNPTLSNFERYYSEISGQGQTSSWMSQAKYKAEQSWIISPSVFESLKESSTEECCDATWYYEQRNITESGNNYLDKFYDYPESVTFTSPKLVQTPVQSNAQSKTPIHWRLDKRTPLFKGEDFFIKFYKKAKTTCISEGNKDASGKPIPSPKFNKEKYGVLDIKSTRSVSLTRSQGREVVLSRGENYAVSIESANAGGNEDKFDFYNQAYYIVELGVDSYKDRNYFIIIAERANPVFIMKQRLLNGYVSKTLGVFEGISGAQLIDAESFLMTVRNHLGKIIIEFDVGGNKLQPWIVSGSLWYLGKDDISKQPKIEEKAENILVPRGKMALWGGNIKCGFVFGPLQYARGDVAFLYPPKYGAEEHEGEGGYKDLYGIHDVVGGSPEDLSDYEISAVFDTAPCFLPMGGDHHLMLTSSNLYLSELKKNVYIPDQSFSKYDLFTQDAQYYIEHHDTVSGVDGKSRSFSGVSSKPGYYFYGPIQREFSDATPNQGVAKTSFIAIRKGAYVNNLNNRHQAFDMMVGLVCGDHLFSSTSWNLLGNEDLSSGSVDPGKNLQPRNYGSRQLVQLNYVPGLNEWLLPNAKTPILTHIRLIADEGKQPRWDDGTTIRSGIAKTPYDTPSPHYVDATEHVINYSESWKTNSWSEIEHTGSINFYLNRDMVSIDSNVTDYLLSLQNKNFYVDIWAGYRNCSAAGFVGLYKMFTGICQGGQISYEYNKNIMSCKVVDYTVVLKSDRFVNSPWFDGMKDINAIWEICRMAGFRSRGKYDPGIVLRVLSEMAAKGASQMFFHHWDGRLFKMEPFALPSGYNRLEQPMFKFNDGESFYDGVIKIAQKTGKAFYFDQFGLARYEDLQDVIEKDYLGTTHLVPLFQFTTNPMIWGGQLVFNKLDRTYDVAGINNHIKIISNTPDLALILQDDLSWNSIENPNTEGFLGYKKMFMQQEGMIGSPVAVLNMVNKYKVMWRPPITVTFETYGTPLRANDIISINGEVTRVVGVEHQIDAQKNEWWMTVECLKYQTVSGTKMIEDTEGQEWG